MTGACGDTSTRVRLVFTVDDAPFRPDFLDVVWGAVGVDQQQRTARIPSSGDLAVMDGNSLGSVLIILSDDRPLPRRFVARGTRGTERVSGCVRTVPWDAGHETTVTMPLGCYEDPDPKFADPVPNCRSSARISDGADSLQLPPLPTLPTLPTSDAGNQR